MKQQIEQGVAYIAADPPPLNAGASLKPGAGGKLAHSLIHSPPLNAGASLKPRRRPGPAAGAVRIPPRLMRGPH